MARGEEGGLVEMFARSAPVNPGVRAAIARSSTSGQGNAARVHPQDLLAAPQVGTIDHDLAVEASGADQRRVQDVGTVGGGHDDHALVGVETVHLHQELVQGLLALVVAPEPGAHSPASPLADRVDLVQEHERGRLLLGLLEQFADARGAQADEHLDELRTRHEEERDVGFAGDGARKQRFRSRAAREAGRPWGY